MSSNNDHYCNILRENGGFYPVEKWLQFAKMHNFQKTNSIKLKNCPDCNNERLFKFGQYIYYSNIFCIKFCPNCGLYFSDTLLDKEIIAKHFENTYNDELYFSKQRKDIFDHIASLASKYTPENGKVLDIGGGKGHLLHKIKSARPDISAVLNDLSENSCNYSFEIYAMKSICCDMPSLQKINSHFNTILLIDVIYYEPKLNEMFKTINKLLHSKQQTIIIRIPNKLRIIKFYQFLLNTFGLSKNKTFQSEIKHFNPEHIYIFTQSYILKKLKKEGFNKVTFIPSPLLNNNKVIESLSGNIFFWVANVICKLTIGRLILTPSMVVIAKKSEG